MITYIVLLLNACFYCKAIRAVELTAYDKEFDIDHLREIGREAVLRPGATEASLGIQTKNQIGVFQILLPAITDEIQALTT